MNIPTDKIREEVKSIFEELVKDASGKDILQSLTERIDLADKIDKLYHTRLAELVEEQKSNNRLADDIKLVETKISLRKN